MALPPLPAGATNLSNPYGGMAPPTPQAPAQSRPIGAAPQTPFDPLFSATEQKYRLPPGMLKAVAWKESGFNPQAAGQQITNPRSAHYGHQAAGMFQFMPNTWVGEGHEGNPLNPVHATEAAARKLQAGLQRRGTIGGALMDYYGRGTAPDGHPSTTAYAQDIVDRMNAVVQSSPPPQQAAPVQQGRQFIPDAVDNRPDFSRGLGHAVSQIPQTGYGLAAAAGATAENILGPGGVSMGLKNWGLKGYQRKGAEQYASSKESDSLTHSWEQAQKGDYGSMVDWLQYGLGYGGGQVLQALGSFGIGGVVGKHIAKGAVEKVATGMVAKEAAKIAATEAGKNMAAGVLRQEAVRNVAKRIGQYAGVAGSAYGMTGGEIGGGLVERTTAEGRNPTGDELATAFGSTLAAGSLESVADLLGLSVLSGKNPLMRGLNKQTGWKGKVGRGTAAAGVAIPAETGTEFAQTYIEEHGKGNPWNESTYRQAIDAAGLGAIGGGGVSIVGGALSKPMQAPVIPVPPELATPGGVPGAPPATGGLQQVETNPILAAQAQEKTWMENANQQLQDEKAWLAKQTMAPTVAPTKELPVQGAPMQVAYLVRDAFPATKRPAVYARVMTAIHAGDTGAVAAFQEELANMKTSTVERETAVQALSAALPTLMQQYNNERAVQVETIQPGQVKDMFGAPASTPLVQPEIPAEVAPAFVPEGQKKLRLTQPKEQQNGQVRTVPKEGKVGEGIQGNGTQGRQKSREAGVQKETPQQGVQAEVLTKEKPNGKPIRTSRVVSPEAQPVHERGAQPVPAQEERPVHRQTEVSQNKGDESNVATQGRKDNAGLIPLEHIPKNMIVEINTESGKHELNAHETMKVHSQAVEKYRALLRCLG